MTASLSSIDSPPPEGLAFLCAPDGAIAHVAAASLEGAELRASLHASVDPSSAEACTLFLRSVSRGGFGRSTPLRIGTRDVHCFGLCRNDVIRIVGVIDPATAAQFADSIEGFADVAEEIRRTESTYELYEELARLNNELVTAQRELARTVAELRRLNDYKDELLGMAAHDLRNPLNANAAFITFLLQDAATMNEDNLVLLRRLETNSRYMLRLVESVLDFSAIQSGHVRLQPEETPIDDLARSVVETMRIIADARQVEVRYVATRELPSMRIDRVKMTQALQNLVSNAVQYSPAGAVVELRAHTIEGGVELEVEDRGPGIPAEELPDLFKPFTRLSTASVSRQRSVGLGLAITKRLIEAHGGTIEVKSEVGKGSIFTVRLRS
ncbi:MAG TPA: HAMP domain-containing sensor histidine kinase [Thermoanaerobaculia bacterium]|nr:HAMP domain-containing sensor histidine kinase [Thermoanaerobaculia bacterium]